MLAPSIFSHSLSDDFFNDSFNEMFRDVFRPAYDRMSQIPYMTTDVKDLGDTYQMEVELPGYEKKDLKAEVQDGYLTISAEKNMEKNEKGEDDKFVRRERYYGSCKRSFYVGDGITQEDIHASFENGVLKLTIPKKDAPVVEEKKYIPIH